MDFASWQQRTNVWRKVTSPTSGAKQLRNGPPKQAVSAALCVLPEDDFHKTMMLREAKSIARHLGLTLRQVRVGAYRVNFRDGNETTAYYTDNLEDAVKTAVEMARTRDVAQAVNETERPEAEKIASHRIPNANDRNK
jgi:hypothetical protein